MHHPTYMPRTLGVGIILAASDISGLTVLGEPPDRVVERMSLPERGNEAEQSMLGMEKCLCLQGDPQYDCG